MNSAEKKAYAMWEANKRKPLPEKWTDVYKFLKMQDRLYLTAVGGFDRKIQSVNTSP